MLLSIGMIADHLQDFQIRSEYHGFEKRLNLERCKFFTEDLTLNNDTVYIVIDKYCQNLQTAKAEEGTAIIFLDQKEKIKEYFTNQTACIHISGADPFMVINRINSIFESFRRMDELFHKTVRTGGGLQKIVEIATPLFDNEITVRDKDHRYVARSYKNLLFYDDFGDSQPDSDGYASKEEINQLQFDGDYREECPDTEPWLYEWGGCGLLCLDVFIGDRFVYRVKISDIRHSFRTYDAALLKYLVEIIKEYHLFALCQSNPEKNRSVAFWIDMIEQKRLPDADVRWNLQELKMGKRRRVSGCICDSRGI